MIMTIVGKIVKQLIKMLAGAFSMMWKRLLTLPTKNLSDCSYIMFVYYKYEVIVIHFTTTPLNVTLIYMAPINITSNKSDTNALDTDKAGIYELSFIRDIALFLKVTWREWDIRCKSLCPP